ncbi:MAG: hypothetical protein AB1797_11725 [bacterium]
MGEVVSQDDHARLGHQVEKKGLIPIGEIVIEWFAGNFRGSSFRWRRVDMFSNLKTSWANTSSILLDGIEGKA